MTDINVPTKAKLSHYLVTLSFPSVPSMYHMHAYLMSKEDHTERVMNKMMDETEIAWANAHEGLQGEALPLPPPIFLVTPLSTSVDTVREIIGNHYPEAKKAIESAKKFHLTIWGMPPEDPDDERLMAIH